MSTIYAPTFATVVAKPGTYKSTTYGGGDAPIAAYPEWAASEAVKVVAGAGPGGINVIDLDPSTGDTAGNSGVALIHLAGASDYSGSQGCVTWKQSFNAAYQAASGYSQIIAIASRNGSVAAGAGLIFGAAIRLYVELQFSGALGLNYVTFSGSGSVATYTPTLDNAYHDMKLEWQCGTPNGGFTDATADGWIKLWIDGVVIYSVTGIKLLVSDDDNNLTGVWFGYFGLLGPVGGITVRNAVCTPTPVFTDPPATSPAIPTVTCKPSTTVLTSPSPQAGCNQGGIGWTPTYTGPSGTVPVGADPVAGETLTGKSAVHVWAEITNTIYPAGTTTETLRYAMTDLDDATRKEGRLLSIGEVEFSVSDAQGNMQAGTVDIQISDVNGRPIGTRLIDSTKKYLARNEIAVFCLSDAGRRAGTRAKRIGRALLQDDRYGSPVVAKFSGVDPFFCDGGAFGPDKKVPLWTIPLYYVNAPTDVYARAFALIFGEVSDEGAIDPVTNLPSARGLCPLTFVGMDGLATGAGGAAEQWGRFNVCLLASYRAVGLYGSNLGGGLYGRATATSNGATPSVVTLGGSPDLSGVAVDGSVTMTLYTAKGRQTSQITAVSGSSVTLNNTIAAVDATAVDWVIGEAQPTRVKIDLATRNGQDCMVFGYPNYVRPTNYEDIMGSDGEVYRVTDVWVRGPLLDDHLAGIVTLTANMIGVEDVGDSTGLPITDYFTAYNWFLENVLVANGRGGLSPAADGDLHAYADGTYIIKGSTFVAAQASSAVDVGGSGFKVGAYFGTQISTRDAIQLWNDNGGCRLGVNEDGQIFVYRLNRSDDTTTWPRVEHVNRVFGEVERTHPNTEIENVVQGTCDWDPDAQRYRNPLTVFISSAGILHNKTIRKYSKLIDGKLTRDPQQWNYILQQRLAYAQDGPVYVTFTGDIGLLDYAIGSGIQFTSIMGPGAAGYVDQPLVILSKRFHVDSHLVTLTCLDVGSGSGMGLMIPAAQQFLITDNSGTAPTVSDTDAIAMVVAT